MSTINEEQQPIQEQLEVALITREFILEDENQTIPLADPDPNWRVERVLNHYAPLYPILTNATIVGPVYINGKRVFTFKSIIGSKG